MPRDERYYDRLANYLAELPVGKEITISDIVKTGNEEKFLECFKWFAGATFDGPFWWEWDDVKGTICKHEHYWYILIREKL